MKKSYLILMLALTLALAPGVGQAAMWVGGQLGGHIQDNSDLSDNGITIEDVKIEPSVIGGISIGYDFIKEGFLGYDWPAWMKYFGVALDFTYNRMEIRDQNVIVRNGGTALVRIPHLNGWTAAWSFLVYAHYGFLPDSEVPWGRLHPYVAVGPGCLLINLDNRGGGTSTEAEIALVAETGVRFFALKNVSLDAAFRYRWAEPEFDVNGATVEMDDYNSFSFLFRASYHF